MISFQTIIHHLLLSFENIILKVIIRNHMWKNFTLKLRNIHSFLCFRRKTNQFLLNTCCFLADRSILPITRDVVPHTRWVSIWPSHMNTVLPVTRVIWFSNIPVVVIKLWESKKWLPWQRM